MKKTTTTTETIATIAEEIKERESFYYEGARLMFLIPSHQYGAYYEYAEATDVTIDHENNTAWIKLTPPNQPPAPTTADRFISILEALSDEAYKIGFYKNVNHYTTHTTALVIGNTDYAEYDDGEDGWDLMFDYPDKEETIDELNDITEYKIDEFEPAEEKSEGTPETITEATENTATDNNTNTTEETAEETSEAAEGTSEETTEAPSIWEQFTDILEDHGHTITEFNEVIGRTPEGGEIVNTLYITDDQKDDPQAIAEAFSDLYEEFDPWEYAHLWLNDDGSASERNGIFSPTTAGGRALCKDCDEYDQDLEELNAAIFRWAYNIKYNN